MSEPDKPLTALKTWWRALGSDTFFAVSPPTRGRYTASDGHEDATEEIGDAGLAIENLLAAGDFGYAFWHWQSQDRAFDGVRQMREPLFIHWGGAHEAVASGIGAAPAGFEVRAGTPEQAFAIATPRVWARYDQEQRRAARQREQDREWEWREEARVAAEREDRRAAGVPVWAPQALDDSHYTYETLWDELADPVRGATDDHRAWLRETLHAEDSPLMAQAMCLEALLGLEVLTHSDLDAILPRWKKDFTTGGKDFAYTGWRHPLATFVCALLTTDHPEADRVLVAARKLKPKWAKDALLHAHPCRPTEEGYQECLQATLDSVPRAVRTRAALRGLSVSAEVDELLTRIADGDPHPDFPHEVIVRSVAVEDIPGLPTVYRAHPSHRHHVQRCLFVAEDRARSAATRRAMAVVAEQSFLLSDPAHMSPPATDAEAVPVRERLDRVRAELGMRD